MVDQYGRCKIMHQELISVPAGYIHCGIEYLLKQKGAPIKGWIFLKPDTKKYNWETGNCKDGSVYYKWVIK